MESLTPCTLWAAPWCVGLVVPGQRTRKREAPQQRIGYQVTLEMVGNGMKTPIEPDAREENAPTCLTTTLYDLMTALHTVVALHEDSLMVALVTLWLQTGRITWLGSAVARRQERRSPMALGQ